MNYGYISISRKFLESDAWLAEPFTKAQAWIDLIGGANHKDGEFFIRGIRIPVKRGQLAWSELTMAKRWRWSRMKVRRFLNDLETRQQTIQQKDRYITTITTIINYDLYQETRQQARQQKDSRRDINNNENNVNNENNKYRESDQQDLGDKPTALLAEPKVVLRHQVNSEYLSELQQKYPALDVATEWESCHNWYGMHGKRIVDWRAALRNWLIKASGFKKRDADTKNSPPPGMYLTDEGMVEVLADGSVVKRETTR